MSSLVGRQRAGRGMYSLLAGFVEPGETVEAAVRRDFLRRRGSQSAGDVSGQPALGLSVVVDDWSLQCRDVTMTYAGPYRA
jgi:ADP-ribose pyrophosphatase YjhB (NUDIX family)